MARPTAVREDRHGTSLPRLAAGCVAVCSSLLAAFARAGRAARAWSSCSPARAARPVRPPTSCSANSRDDPSLVAMSLPIDYWDYLGWKDTLADPRHTDAAARLCAGARRPRGLHAAGRGQRRRARARQRQGRDRAGDRARAARTRRAVAAGDARRSPAASSTSALPDGTPTQRGSAEVWLCALAKAVPVTIGARREQRARTITYHNVVRRWVKLGDWNGKANACAACRCSDARRGDGSRRGRGAGAGRHRQMRRGDARRGAASASAERSPVHARAHNHASAIATISAAIAGTKKGRLRSRP